ncbi:T9SS type A sorting domain-containing protein [candidate division GN15 bacterium]|nr:T9SS type A sorting domain-containing protein [candidate division GN15 bacterium]
MRLLKLTFCLTLGLCLLPAAISAATVDTVWTSTFFNGYWDTTNCLAATSDGGFIIIGATWQAGETQSDISLVKADANGELDWSIEIGDTAQECGFHVLECVEGGYFLSAQSNRYGQGSGAAWFIRTDQNGDTLWSYAFSPQERGGYPIDAIQTADSGFAITGIINLAGQFWDAYILLLDKDGNYRDYAHYGDSHLQSGHFITQLEDNGFIIAVWTDSHYSTQTDFRAIRTNDALAVVWDSTYALSPSAEEVYGGCRVDDGIVMVGNNAGLAHALKVDFDGNTVWSKSISLTPYSERPYSICPTADGNLMVGGWINVAGHRRDFCFLKLTPELDTLWHHTVGGGDDDHGRTVLQTADGNYVMAGRSSSFHNGSCHYLVKIEQTFNTTVGTDVHVALDSGVTVTFDNVTGDGDTQVSVGPDGPPLPGDLQLVPADDPAYYDITTDAAFDGAVDVCIEYDPADVAGEEYGLRLMHYDGAVWSDIRTMIDTLNNLICGTTTTLSPFAIAESKSPMAVGDDSEVLPTRFDLAQNYPNPFNPTTTIEYELPQRCEVTLEVYNVLGQRIATLIDRQQPAGRYWVKWDGTDLSGAPVSSGIYFYRLHTDTYRAMKKMVLVK